MQNISIELGPWKILFLETNVRYWFMRCWTRSSRPYLTVQFFSFDSVSSRKATMQHCGIVRVLI